MATIALYNGGNTIEIYRSVEEMHRNEGFVERFQCSDVAGPVGWNAALMFNGYVYTPEGGPQWRSDRGRALILDVRKVV